MSKRLEIAKEFLDGINWIQLHRIELHREFQGRWIAVYHNKVVASGKTIDSVEKKALENTGASPRKIPLVFMEDPHCIYSVR